MKKRPDYQFKNLFEYYGFTEKEARKYPVLARILKSLTPDKIKKEIEKIRKIKLPPSLEYWIKEYEKIGKRNNFIWRWLYNAFKIVHLPNLRSSLINSLARTKTLLTIFITVLDDLADQNKDFLFLQELSKIPFDDSFSKSTYLSKNREASLEFEKRIWKYFKKEILKYPNFKIFEEIFRFDLSQVINAIQYSCIINRYLYLANLNESFHFFPYNMVSFVYSDLDLMVAKSFPWKNIGKWREAIYYAQKMARIGNWISTWEREIYEDDFANAVIVLGLRREIITFDMLKANKLQAINLIRKAKIEKFLLKKWYEYYLKVNKLEFGKFPQMLEKFLVLHLISRGYK